MLNCVWLFVTHGSVARQALPPWDFPGKNTGVGCHFLLQRIFLTQGSNQDLLCRQANSLPLSYQGSHHDCLSLSTNINQYHLRKKSKILFELKEKKVKSLSRVQLFATPWTVAYQAPPSMGFPGKGSGVGCHFLLQRIFLTQGSDPHLLCLLHCRRILY